MRRSEAQKGRQFGNILSPGGALFEVRSWDDLVAAQVEASRAALILRGVTITPEIEVLIRQRAEADVTRMEQEFVSEGVPRVFTDLFALKKKKDVVKFGRTMKVTGHELALLVGNHEAVGAKHSRKHIELIPEELKFTADEQKAFWNNGVGAYKTKEASRFVRKVMATFDQRKHISAHLFEFAHQWHLFWFTFDDTGRRKHWKHGDHIHYTSYLWNHDKDRVWAALSTPPYSIAGLHIRYAE